MRLVIGVACIFVATCVNAQIIVAQTEGFLQRMTEVRGTPPVDQVLILDPHQVRALMGLDASGKRLVASGIGLFPGEAMELRPVSLYAPEARITIVDSGDRRTLPPSSRVFVHGTGATGSAGFSIDPETSLVKGVILDRGEAYEVSSASLSDGRIRISVSNMRAAIEQTPFQCGAGGKYPTQAKAVIPSGGYPSLRGSFKGSAPLFETVIAVDTDRAFTGQTRFDAGPDAVRDYIEDLFVSMNAIYERDLSLRLLIGDTFINYDSDPYMPMDNNGLSGFTNFWREPGNRNGVERDFAAALGGIGGGFSGSAWLDVYCSQGFGYSYNGIGSTFSSTRAALFVGHEIGHNLGSDHTHCERLANGGNDFVDQCYSCEQYDSNDECSSSCYVGATMCQPGGAGSVMSYCHAPAMGFDGGGPAQGTSQSCSPSTGFHPLIVDLLDSRIAANYPQCIEDFTPPSFELAVSVDGPGTVSSTPAGLDCSEAQCVASFAAGELVTLQANPSAQARLAGWAGECSGTGSCDVVMNQDQLVQAYFVDNDVLIKTGFESNGL